MNFFPITFFKIDDYYVRLLHVRDIKAFRELIRDDENIIFHFLNQDNDAYYTQLFGLAEYNALNNTGSTYLFGIFELTKDAKEKLIGFVGQLKTTSGIKMQLGGIEYHINYKIKKGYRGKGIMSKTLKWFIDWMVQYKKISFAVALTEKSNKASVALLEKLGFDIKFENVGHRIYYKKIFMSQHEYNQLFR